MEVEICQFLPVGSHGFLHVFRGYNLCNPYFEGLKPSLFMVLGSKRGGGIRMGKKKNNEMNRNEPFQKEVFLAGMLTPVHSIWTRVGKCNVRSTQ